MNRGGSRGVQISEGPLYLKHAQGVPGMCVSLMFLLAFFSSLKVTCPLPFICGSNAVHDQQTGGGDFLIKCM